MSSYCERVRTAAAVACHAIHGGCACDDNDRWHEASKLCESRLLAAHAAFTDAAQETARLRKGIQDILDGNYSYPRAYRPGKCPHGIWFYEDCGVCTDEALQRVLDDKPLKAPTEDLL